MEAKDENWKRIEKIGRMEKVNRLEEIRKMERINKIERVNKIERINKVKGMDKKKKMKKLKKTEEVGKMIKIQRGAVVICLAACIFMLAGCGGSSEKVIEGTPENQTVGETAGSEAGKESSGQETEEAGEMAESSAKGYIFLYNGTEIVVDADMAPVLQALGEPDSYFEAESCAFKGLDKIYTYGSFEIDTYPVEEKDYISAIIFKDDAVATAEGISIGDLVEKVKDTYDGYTEETGKIVCEKDGMKLNFIVQDDAVISIEYQSTVLEE